jgi:hypothetical protein
MSSDIKHYSMIIQWDERDNIFLPETKGKAFVALD